ncbi:MAG: tripartite tricarboxylate transporter TctB family protein [Proteobacteria bacterium]|nr:tripartite tricarboxylate transporter TctB family protein [Pseudomonadota bacterium]
MTARLSVAGTEILQLAILLAVVAVFYFVIIPLGVSDPESFGLNQGLPPSFSARLVAVLAALLMLFRLGRILINEDAAMAASITDENDELSSGLPQRGLIGMAAALVFSMLLVPYIGFYLGSALLLCGLLITLGERRPLRLLADPLLVLAVIWLVFGQLLSIRLPAGSLF